MTFYAFEIDLGCVGIADRARTAGKDDPLHAYIERRDLVERVDFTIDIQLPESSADELGDLGTEIKDDDFFGHFALDVSK